MTYGLTRAPSRRDHRPDLAERKAYLEEAVAWERRVTVCGASAYERERADDRRQGLERELAQVEARLAAKRKLFRASIAVAGAIILTAGAVIMTIHHLGPWW